MFDAAARGPGSPKEAVLAVVGFGHEGRTFGVVSLTIAKQRYHRASMLLRTMTIGPIDVTESEGSIVHVQNGRT